MWNNVIKKTIAFKNMDMKVWKYGFNVIQGCGVGIGNIVLDILIASVLKLR